ncbi:GntR family transcriptional regulator [Nonomuraea sp. NPDC059007]|uniref:GntR family transcriptional regulator n=1 Tax=Nonomuraea sp. NPDC059007 TaxID=3346692 RepID=UPI00369C9E5A
MSRPGPTVAPGTGLRRQSLRDDAGQVIRAQIVAGEIRPGALYAIGQLAEQLQVSITPVREALLDLAKEGLIEMVRNRGFRIRVMTEADLDQIIQIRLMLEVPAVREIAARGLVDDFAPLRDLAARTEEAAMTGDWVGFLGTDRELHLTLLGHLGNPRLVDIVAQLRDQGRLYGLDHVAGTQDFIESTREHDALLDAVESGKADEAAELMSTHLKHARGIWAGIAEARSEH